MRTLLIKNYALGLLALFLAGASLAQAQVLIDKRITVQPIYVRSTDGSVTSNASQILYEAETDKIWSQAGIDVLFLAPIYYNNSAYLTPSNAFGSPTTVQGLGQLGGQAWSGLASTVVRLFFVQQLDGDNNVLGFAVQSTLSNAGFGISVNQQNAMAIADNAFNLNRRDVIAHELGHLLGLDHTTHGAGGANNLMSDGSTRNSPTFIGDIYPTGNGYDQLTGTIGGTNYGNDVGPVNGLQIDRARRMDLAVTLPVGQQYTYNAVPEPATNAAIAGGVALVLAGIYRRKRSQKATEQAA